MLFAHHLPVLIKLLLSINGTRPHGHLHSKRFFQSVRIKIHHDDLNSVRQQTFRNRRCPIQSHQQTLIA